MKSNHQGIRLSGPPEYAVEVGWLPPSNERVANRSLAADYVRTLPRQLAGSMLALFLDGDFKLLATQLLGRGNSVECGLKPMLVVRQGAKLGAVGFILIHHAPDRTSRASPEEFKLTREIRKTGEDFDVHLLDHLILGRDRLIDVAA